MGLPVNTVAAGGLPVIDVTATFPRLGAPVSEAAPGKGVAVTKVVSVGLPVTFDAPPFATWDAATVTGVTLTNGGLTITNTGTTSMDQGAHGATASGKTSGKYYFETKINSLLAGTSISSGIGTPSSTYTGMGTNGTTGVTCYCVGGAIYNVGNSGKGLGGRITGDTLGLAVNLDTRKAWLRVAPSGNWNGLAIGSEDPANGIGGVTIPAGTMVPFMTFGGSGGVANNVLTANFGASAFTGAVPSGFTSGWPA